MLAGYMGEEAFFRGLSDYLRKNAYGNTTADVLWDALGQASNRDILPFIRPLVVDVGYPMVSISERALSPAQVDQERFLLLGSATDETDMVKWAAPVTVESIPDPAGRVSASTSPNDGIQDNGATSLIRNQQQTAFCRFEFQHQALRGITATLGHLSSSEQIGLIGDVTAQAISGRKNIDASTLLALLLSFRSEKQYHGWNMVLNTLYTLQSVFSEDRAIAHCLNQLMLDLTSTTVDTFSLDMDSPSGPDYLTEQLKVTLLTHRGLAGHPEINTQAAERFQKFVSGDDSAIPVLYREAVSRIGVRNGGGKVSRAMKEEYRKTTTIDGKQIALRALAEVQSVELAEDFLRFGCSDEVGLEELEDAISALADNPKHCGAQGGLDICARQLGDDT
jgi:aminopeptidase N